MPMLAGRAEVLHRDVGLGAVGRDPGDRRADVAGMPQVLDRADAGQQQHRDLRLLASSHGGGDQLELVLARRTRS